MEYFINYPDAVINNVLSKITTVDVNIRFRLIEFLRSKLNIYIDLSKFKANTKSSEISTIRLSFDFADNEKTDNWFEAVLKGLALAFQIDALTDVFQEIIQAFKPTFNFNSWYDGLSLLSKNFFDDIILSSITAMNTMFSYVGKEFTGKIEDAFKNWSIGKITEEIIGEELNSLLDVLDIFNSLNENFSNNYSIDYSFLATFIDIGSFMICFMVPEFVIGIDLINDLFKKILFNIDTGRFWG